MHKEADQIVQAMMDHLKKSWDNDPALPPTQPTTLYEQMRQRHRTRSFEIRATTHLARCVFVANHFYNKTGKRETIETLLKGDMSDIWKNSVSNEFGRLTQGNKHGVTFTDTMDFIFKHCIALQK